MLYDVIFKNTRICDGTGNPWFKGSVAIKDGKIALVGMIPDETRAREEIDVQGHVLSPGFIDLHTHSDFVLLREPSALSKLKQGVTTQVIGQCGLSPAPIRAEKVQLLDSYLGFLKAGVEPEWVWCSFGDWLNVLENLKLGTNVAGMFGHGTIRINVMGFDDRTPTNSEIGEMKKMIRESMAEGAFGMSSGLAYPPALYSSKEEIIEVTSALADFNGIYASHMLNESYDVVNCVKDTIEVAERNGIRGQISHHKVSGRKNWGKIKETLKLIEQARNRGVDIVADQYPYTATSTTLRSILPPWVCEGGLECTIERLQDNHLRNRIKDEINTPDADWWENQLENCGGPENAVILYTPETPDYQGKNLFEISQMMGKDPLDTAFDIIIKNKGCDTACYFEVSEEDIQYLLKNPLVMVISDSIPPAPGAKCHPRVNGTFPRVLGKYVREEGVLNLEQAVWKMTGFPASRLGLQDKGLVRVGMDADLVVFNQEKIIDCADYNDPGREPQGIDYVFVNGQKVLDHGTYTGKTPGKVIRRS